MGRGSLGARPGLPPGLLQRRETTARPRATSRSHSCSLEIGCVWAEPTRVCSCSYGNVIPQLTNDRRISSVRVPTTVNHGASPATGCAQPLGVGRRARGAIRAPLSGFHAGQGSFFPQMRTPAGSPRAGHWQGPRGTYRYRPLWGRWGRGLFPGDTGALCGRGVSRECLSVRSQGDKSDCHTGITGAEQGVTRGRQSSRGITRHFVVLVSKINFISPCNLLEFYT